MLNLKKIALVAGVLAAFSLNTSAQTIPSVTSTHITNITVTNASPTTSCSLGANPTGAGSTVSSLSYVSGTTTTGVGYGSQIIKCNGTDATAYSVSANTGLNASASSRRAKSANGDYINYQLTAFSMLGTVVFDTATAPSFSGSAITGITSISGASNQGYVSFNVNVPANQTVPTGSYTDTVTLTATF